MSDMNIYICLYVYSNVNIDNKNIVKSLIVIKVKKKKKKNE